MVVVILYFCIHTIIAVILISVAGVYHAEINNYASLTKDDINSVPSIAIAVGIIFFIFIIGSCFIQNMCSREGYIMMCVLFLMVLLGSSIHGSSKMTDKSKILQKTIQKDMEGQFLLYNTTNNTKYIKDLLHVQHKLKCCGVNNPDDYKSHEMPISCCPEPMIENVTVCKDVTKHYQDGCMLKVYDIVLNDISIVAYVSIGLTVLQVFVTLYIALKLTGVNHSCLNKIRTYENF